MKHETRQAGLLKKIGAMGFDLPWRGGRCLAPGSRWMSVLQLDHFSLLFVPANGPMPLYDEAVIVEDAEGAITCLAE